MQHYKSCSEMCFLVAHAKMLQARVDRFSRESESEWEVQADSESTVSLEIVVRRTEDLVGEIAS